MVFPIWGQMPPSPGVSTPPDPVAGAGTVYTEDVGGNVELFYEDSAGNDVQITSGGTVLGGGGGGWVEVRNEVPTGVVNGSNDSFSLAFSPIAGSQEVYKNGVRQKPGATEDYTISGSTIVFNAGNIPQTGDVLLCDYRKP